MKLSLEHWFKIYLIIDNIDDGKEYDKVFLLLVEYIKDLLRDPMMVYLSSVESLSPDIHTELFGVLKTAKTLSVEQRPIYENEHRELLVEYNKQIQDVNDIVKIDISFDVPLIPNKFLRYFDLEELEVLSCIFEGGE